MRTRQNVYSLKTLLFLILLVVAWPDAFGQSYSYDWGKQLGGTSQDMGQSIAVDRWSNVVTTGYFQGTGDFDPGVGNYSLTTTGGILPDIFVSRLDSSGKFLWARSFGSSSNDFGRSVAVDLSGNIYVTGSFNGTIDFDPGTGTAFLSAIGGTNAFILKLDSSGNFLWAKQLVGRSDGNGITIDKSGNVCLIGNFSGTVDFNTDVGTYYLTADLAGSAFNVKLDGLGNFLWARKIGGNYGNAIAIDGDNNIFSTGELNGTMDFDPGTSVFNLTSNGSSDIFINKLDSNGGFLWAKAIGGKNGDRGYSISTDKLGSVYTAGVFSGTVDFDPDPSASSLLKGPGTYSGVIFKLDKGGSFVWAKMLGDNAYVNGIAVDSSCNVYATGLFNVSMVLSSESKPPITLSSIAVRDIFILMLDSAADFAWAKSLEGIKGSGNTGYAIAYDNDRNIYTTGYFGGTVDFDPGTSIDSLTSFGSTSTGWASDIFVHKMNRCGIFTTISETACKSYTSPSGKSTWTNSGKYIDKITLNNGCDSVITINLIIKKIDKTVTNLSPTLIANETGATFYHWYNCDSLGIIIGIGKNYTATKNGRYRVVVMKDGCIDTSLCYAITNLSIDKTEPKNGIKIYPNPTTGNLFIDYYTPINIEVIDLFGKIVLSKENTKELDLESLSAGMYFIKTYLTNGIIIGVEKIQKIR